MSLAVESSAQTPPEKRNIIKKKKKNRLSLMTLKEHAEHSQNLPRPEIKKDFMNLDFVSRCAVAGLQLGRSKVFLRREAFDRIEAMRSQKFFGSTVKIQAVVQGKIYRDQYKRMRAAAILIQSIMRITLARNMAARRKTSVLRLDMAATLIQRFYKMTMIRRGNTSILCRNAAIIQAGRS